MATNSQNEQFFALADNFINLANELAKTAGTSDTGAALRYAAARYNTFEASLSTNNLAEEQQKMVDMLCDDFRKMLDINMQDYIQRLTENE